MVVYVQKLVCAKIFQGLGGEGWSAYIDEISIAMNCVLDSGLQIEINNRDSKIGGQVYFYIKGVVSMEAKQ